MALITVLKTYQDGTVLFEADLDNIKESIETFLNVTKINDDNIQDAGITGSTKLVNSSVTAAKLAASAVETAKINDLAVTTAKLADLSVTTGKLADLGVTTGKLAAESVTQAKRAALGQQSSSHSGNFTTTSGSLVDVTNLSVSITTTGRPVFIGLIGRGGGNTSYLSAANAGDIASALLSIVRDSTSVLDSSIYTRSDGGASATIQTPVSVLNHVDVPSAGTYTYKVQVARGQASTTVTVLNAILIAYEL